MSKRTRTPEDWDTFAIRLIVAASILGAGTIGALAGLTTPSHYAMLAFGLISLGGLGGAAVVSRPPRHLRSGTHGAEKPGRHQATERLTSPPSAHRPPLHHPAERSSRTTAEVRPRRQQPEPPLPTLTFAQVLSGLEAIDWYQFEKFCAALLEAEGFQLQRQGGAHPDGGVDLIASRHGVPVLVQCKQWRKWKVRENIVRELLGSMVHFDVRHAALYTLAPVTPPAARLAATHHITLCDGRDLADRALAHLPPAQLERLLDSSEHHCPKCEAPMILREGKFKSFWGCSRYPKCKGKLEHRSGED